VSGSDSRQGQMLSRNGTDVDNFLRCREEINRLARLPGTDKLNSQIVAIPRHEKRRRARTSRGTRAIAAGTPRSRRRDRRAAGCKRLRSLAGAAPEKAEIADQGPNIPSGG